MIYSSFQCKAASSFFFFFFSMGKARLTISETSFAARLLCSCSFLPHGHKTGCFSIEKCLWMFAINHWRHSEVLPEESVSVRFAFFPSSPPENARLPVRLFREWKQMPRNMYLIYSTGKKGLCIFSGWILFDAFIAEKNISSCLSWFNTQDGKYSEREEERFTAKIVHFDFPPAARSLWWTIQTCHLTTRGTGKRLR